MNCSVLEGHLPQKTLLRHRRSTETLHFAIVKRSPLSWTGKLYERGGVGAPGKPSTKPVSYNKTTKGKDQILKMGANKTLKLFLSWPSISYALPCILADLSLLLFQRFWAIFSSCVVCSFHSTVFGPAFCSSLTS